MTCSTDRPISSRLRGILKALNTDATDARRAGRDLEANALWNHHRMLAEVYDQALDEEWRRAALEQGVLP